MEGVLTAWLLDIAEYKNATDLIRKAIRKMQIATGVSGFP
jgi:hypothetical protein